MRLRSWSDASLGTASAGCGAALLAFVTACTSSIAAGDVGPDSSREAAGDVGPSGSAVRVPRLFAPELVGALVGPAAARQPSVPLWGTDLGWTFVHRGRHTMLFGDSMPDARFYCDEHDPAADDALATLPLMPPEGVPELDLVTPPGDPSRYATLTVNRDGAPLPMGLGRTPSTAWSDGEHAFAMVGHIEFTRCKHGMDGGDGCDADAGLTCSHDVGTCMPALTDFPTFCTLDDGAGCGAGQTCTAPDDGYCVDLTCSQYDGTPRSVPFAIARNTELAMEREDDLSVFDTVHTFSSKKFHYSVARTVTRLATSSRDDDYSPGTGALLVWGRPGFSGENGRQVQLYLLKHALPLRVSADGALAFQPEFFAGVDPASGEPRWSSAQRDAVGIALDGKRDGSPEESLPVVNQFSMSWLGPPVRKWMMLYGGDVPDALLVTPNDPDEQRTRGPLRVRFADRPWGPFSPAAEYLAPGSPAAPGDPYGPGGFLYHDACVDRPGAPCARTDPVRPADTYLPGCLPPEKQLDIGRLYGSNIIDAYTRPSADGGLLVAFNVSTWNPYGVVLLRARIAP